MLLIFFCRKYKNVAQATNKIRVVYGEGAITERTVQKWFVRFKTSDFNPEGREHRAETCVLIQPYGQQLINFFWKVVRNKMNREKEPKSNAAAPAKKHHWSAGLLVSMKDPKCIVKEDDTIVVIRDKYPKAKFHYLVIPKANILTIWDVKKEDEDLLLHMDNVAEELSKQHPKHKFIIGYHALPSMQRLHLHVISTDFNSQCLKNKYHWNSFTTPFFMPSKEICKQLNEKGELQKMSHEKAHAYLNRKLQCHKCSVTPKNMSELKRHLLSHL